MSCWHFFPIALFFLEHQAVAYLVLPICFLGRWRNRHLCGVLLGRWAPDLSNIFTSFGLDSFGVLCWALTMIPWGSFHCQIHIFNHLPRYQTMICFHMKSSSYLKLTKHSEAAPRRDVKLESHSSIKLRDEIRRFRPASCWMCLLHSRCTRLYDAHASCSDQAAELICTSSMTGDPPSCGTLQIETSGAFSTTAYRSAANSFS